MHEFTKSKISFALAMLGTLFALHPFLKDYPDLQFNYLIEYLKYPIKVQYIFFLTAGLLALTVYCYGIDLMRERPSTWLERVGNTTYALAISVPPLFGGLYLASLLEAQLDAQIEQGHLKWLARAAPFLPLGLGVAWLLLSQLLAWRLRRRIGERDRNAKAEQLALHEIDALNRAREMFASTHYDLSVIEAWKAIEARLRRVLLQKRVRPSKDTPEAMIDVAARKGLVNEGARAMLQELRRQWNVAVSTEPLSRAAADAALGAARNILATIPVDEPGRRAAKAL